MEIPISLALVFLFAISCTDAQLYGQKKYGAVVRSNKCQKYTNYYYGTSDYKQISPCTYVCKTGGKYKVYLDQDLTSCGKGKFCSNGRCSAIRHIKTCQYLFGPSYIGLEDNLNQCLFTCYCTKSKAKAIGKVEDGSKCFDYKSDKLGICIGGTCRVKKTYSYSKPINKKYPSYRKGKKGRQGEPKKYYKTTTAESTTESTTTEGANSTTEASTTTEEPVPPKEYPKKYYPKKYYQGKYPGRYYPKKHGNYKYKQPKKYFLKTTTEAPTSTQEITSTEGITSTEVITSTEGITSTEEITSTKEITSTTEEVLSSTPEPPEPTKAPHNKTGEYSKFSKKSEENFSKSKKADESSEKKFGDGFFGEKKSAFEESSEKKSASSFEEKFKGPAKY